VLIAYEARVNGRFVHRFDIIGMETLAVEKHADSPSSLTLFYRWENPA
jgi:hypothetical protein